MLMSLGMFVFSVPTLVHQEMARKTEYRHAKSDRVGARPAYQFVGLGEETRTLSGSAFAEISDPEGSLQDLREMAREGAAWPLVDGSGLVHGQFVIASIDEKHRHIDPNGKARQVDFTLELILVADPQPMLGNA